MSLAAVFSVLLLLISNVATFAADYTITVNDTNLSKNQHFIFNEINIGPGFMKKYPVQFVNQSAQTIEIALYDLEIYDTNTLTLDELNLIFEYNGKTLIDMRNGPDQGVLICMAPDTAASIPLETSMDSHLGNEFQDKSFDIEMTFMGYAADCNVATDIDNTNRGPLPALPNTGESRSFYYFLFGAIIFFTLLTIILLIIFIIIKKRHNRENRDEKSSI